MFVMPGFYGFVTADRRRAAFSSVGGKKVSGGFLIGRRPNIKFSLGFRTVTLVLFALNKIIIRYPHFLRSQHSFQKRLFEFTFSWNSNSKHIFKSILKRINGTLMYDLHLRLEYFPKCYCIEVTITIKILAYIV